MSVSAGCRSFSLCDESSGRTVALFVLYPSDAPEQPAQVGSYTLDVASDAPISGGAFPLVVVSHGNGGSGVLYRSTALHLARNGYIVALPDHAGNTRGDNDLAGTAANLENRPRDVRLVVDWAFGASPFAAHLLAGAVAVIGHSLGGYTALAVAGAQPDGVAQQSADERVRAVCCLRRRPRGFGPPERCRACTCPS
jgi:predicted dienelactone hydrolase